MRPLLLALTATAAMAAVTQAESGGFVSLTADPSSGTLRPMNVDDQRLAAVIEEKLRMDQRINWQMLEVKAEQGHVQLFGVVKTPEEKGLATRIVTSQRGISSVDDRIVVDPTAPETEKKPDLKEDRRPRVLEGEGQIKHQEILP
jgi:osmotically-inducible protein OsmY